VFLFVGYSHRDPDIDTLIDDVIFDLGEDRPPVYTVQLDCSAFDQECFKARGMTLINIQTNGKSKEETLMSFFADLHTASGVEEGAYKELRDTASIFSQIGDAPCLAIITALEGSRLAWGKVSLGLNEVSAILGVPIDKNLSDSMHRLTASGLVKREHSGKGSVFRLTRKWDNFINETGIARRNFRGNGERRVILLSASTFWKPNRSEDR
jgi:hypothetical protein